MEERGGGDVVGDGEGFFFFFFSSHSPSEFSFVFGLGRRVVKKGLERTSQAVKKGRKARKLLRRREEEEGRKFLF